MSMIFVFKCLLKHTAEYVGDMLHVHLGDRLKEGRILKTLVAYKIDYLGQSEAYVLSSDDIVIPIHGDEYDIEALMFVEERFRNCLDNCNIENKFCAYIDDTIFKPEMKVNDLDFNIIEIHIRVEEKK